MAEAIQSAFDDHLKAIQEKFGPVKKLAIAVSGGSDSMAVCLVANDWCLRHHVPLTGITVDHGLRVASKAEAQTVKVWLSDLQMEHHTITWDGPYPSSGVQQSARDARYQLLQQKCDELDVDVLVLGHQLEDQLETFLMRFSKGSGVQGLAAMQTYRTEGNLIYSRPFLAVERQVLRDYLKDQGQGWIDDPSNVNPLYTRTQLGGALDVLKSLPESNMHSMALSSRRIQRADNALDTITSDYLKREAMISPLGFVTFSADFLNSIPEEIAVRFLLRLFTFVRGGNRGPSITSLESLLPDLANNRIRAGKTLNGCQIRIFKGCWLICREPGRKGLPEDTVLNGENFLWDDRFEIRSSLVNLDQRLIAIRKIGDEGWRQLKESPDFKVPPVLPAIVSKNLPSVWIDDKMVSMPLLSSNFSALGIAQGCFEMVFNPKYKLF